MAENENNQSKFFNEDYNKIVSQEELDDFCADFKARVANKAREIGITDDELLRLSKLSEVDTGENLTEAERQEKIIFFQKKLEKKAEELRVPVEKLSKLVEFDLESLDNLASNASKDLSEEEKTNNAGNKNDPEVKRTKIKRGDFENIKYNLEEALKELEAKDKIAFSTESIAVRKGKISKASLFLYLSSAIAGAPILEDIAGKEKAKSRELTYKDFMENPELIREIDEFNNKNTPKDILRAYDFEQLSYNNIILEFKVNKEYNSKKAKEEHVVTINNLIDRADRKERVFRNDFKNLTDSVGGNNYSLSLPIDEFIENKDKVIELIVKDLGIPKQEASSYMERFLSLDVSKISIVPLKDFKIDTSINYSQKMSEFNKKKEELDKKYSAELVKPINNPDFAEELLELHQWSKDNKIDDKSPIVKFLNFKHIMEEKNEEENNFEQFRELFIKALSDEGETINHLKEISKDNPEKVIEITAKVLGKNISYDYEELAAILAGAGKDNKWLEKHNKGIAFSTLDTGTETCHGYAATFAAAMKVLEKEGVANLDKLMVLYTNSDARGHAWTIF